MARSYNPVFRNPAASIARTLNFSNVAVAKNS